MKTLFALLAVAALSVSGTVVFAADKDLAAALAAAGAAHAAKGNWGQAKDQLFKALANDEACPEAVFELAKIFDKEGNTAAAGDFFQRASVLLAQDPKPANNAKRVEALGRVKTLNPFAPRMGSLYEDYAQELDKLVKKNTDTLTQDSALERVDQLKLSNVLPPEKMPKFYATAQAAAKFKKEEEKKVAAEKKANGSSSSSGFRSSSSRVEKEKGMTAPDVEKELKALGWATVKGKFVKKGPGVYEATDAKLEAPFLNGAVDVTVVKEGFKGTVKASVRSDFNSEYESSDYTAQGYGFVIKAKDYREYVPYESMGFSSSSRSAAEPYDLMNAFPMPADTPKVQFMISIADIVLEYTVNGKRNNRFSNKKIPKSGPFVLDINGTVTLENPRCGGQ